MRWWIKMAIALVILALAALLALSLGNNLVNLIGGIHSNDGARDPMFAEEAVSVTRPPEIYPEETQKPHKTLDDYVPEEETPVDKTAQELIAEAQAQ